MFAFTPNQKQRHDERVAARQALDRAISKCQIYNKSIETPDNNRPTAAAAAGLLDRAISRARIRMAAAAGVAPNAVHHVAAPTAQPMPGADPAVVHHVADPAVVHHVADPATVHHVT